MWRVRYIGFAFEETSVERLKFAYIFNDISEAGEGVVSFL